MIRDTAVYMLQTIMPAGVNNEVGAADAAGASAGADIPRPEPSVFDVVDPQVACGMDHDRSQSTAHVIETRLTRRASSRQQHSQRQNRDENAAESKSLLSNASGEFEEGNKDEVAIASPWSTAEHLLPSDNTSYL